MQYRGDLMKLCADFICYTQIQTLTSRLFGLLTEQYLNTDFI